MVFCNFRRNNRNWFFYLGTNLGNKGYPDDFYVSNLDLICNTINFNIDFRSSAKRFELRPAGTTAL